MSQSNADGPKHEDMQPELKGPAIESNSAQSPPGGMSPGMAGAGFGAGSSGRSPSARGAAYSAPPGTSQPTTKTVQTGNSWKKIGAVAVVAAAVAVGGLVGAMHFAGSGSGGVVTAVTQKNIKVLKVAKVDSDSKSTDRLKAILAAGGTADKGALDALKATNAPALVSLAKTSPQMVQDIQSGQKILYRILLLDSQDEDGDHAEMFVDGVSFGDVALKNAGQEFLIPLTPGKPADIKLLATVDGGGGGVTIGFMSSLNEVRTDVLQVGQSEEWQVQVQ